MAFKFNPFTGNFDDVADVAEKLESSDASVTDNAIVRWDGTTGRLVQDSLVTIDDSGNVVITGDLTVNGTTTTLNTATLDVEDTNISVNVGGNDASSEGAGLTVERTGTNGSFVYQDSLATKFKIGALGSEVEIADISTAQTFTNKTINASNNTITNITNSEIGAGAAINATKISSGVVSNTEFDYLNGVTSAIQTQLDAKLDDIGSSTDNALVRWDGAAGEAVQNSLVTLDDAGIMSGLTQLNVDNLRLDGNVVSSTDLNGNITFTPNGTGTVISSAEFNMSSNKIVSLADPTNAQDAVTKTYYETNIYSANSVSGVTGAANFQTYLVDTSGGVGTINLPAPSADAFIRIKDKGNANTNNITINPNAAETIDGGSSFVIDSDYGAAIVVSDGTNWFVL